MKKQMAITAIAAVSMFGVGNAPALANQADVIKDLRQQVRSLQHRNDRQAKIIFRCWDRIEYLRKARVRAFDRGVRTGYEQTMVELEMGDYDEWMIMHLELGEVTLGQLNEWQESGISFGTIYVTP